jgi:hypothetical protein
MVEILRAMIFLLEHSFFLVLPFLAHRALHPDFILFKLRSGHSRSVILRAFGKFRECRVTTLCGKDYLAHLNLL